MSPAILKNKINKSLEEMDGIHLKSAYLILREFINQQKYSNFKVVPDLINPKISKGIQQLDNGEGTDFKTFLDQMQKAMAKRTNVHSVIVILDNSSSRLKNEFLSFFIMLCGPACMG
ncbi:MAG: hypothetical protein ABI863_23185 [Ginsengibacter sp.]